MEWYILIRSQNCNNCENKWLGLYFICIAIDEPGVQLQKYPEQSVVLFPLHWWFSQSIARTNVLTRSIPEKIDPLSARSEAREEGTLCVVIIISCVSLVSHTLFVMPVSVATKWSVQQYSPHLLSPNVRNKIDQTLFFLLSQQIERVKYANVCGGERSWWCGDDTFSGENYWLCVVMVLR